MAKHLVHIRALFYASPSKGASPDDLLEIDTFASVKNGNFSNVVEEKQSENPAYNPYPILGAPQVPCWPRGFPLDILHLTENKTIPSKPQKFAVLQSLADYEPDMDALFRLTYNTPFVFKRNAQRSIIKVPQTQVTPYNAQATLHFYNSFWALYLPVTVAGRVSDIWRSYFSQESYS